MNFTPDAIHDIMHRQFEELCRLDATAAPSVEALFPFRAEDVYIAHFHRMTEGDGIWFRLFDDRVFDRYGQLAESDPVLYIYPPKN
jgi:hypothetical protein